MRLFTLFFSASRWVGALLAIAVFLLGPALHAEVVGVAEPVADPLERAVPGLRIGAVLVLLWTVWRVVTRRRARARDALRPDPMEATRAYAPKVPGGANKAHDFDYAFKARAQPVAMSGTIRPDTPMGRLAVKTAKAPSDPARSMSDRRSVGLEDLNEVVARRTARDAQARLATSFSRVARTLGGLVVLIFVASALEGVAPARAGTGPFGLIAVGLTVLFLPVAAIWLAIRYAGARFAVSAAGGKAALKLAEHPAAKGPTRIPAAAPRPQPGTPGAPVIRHATPPETRAGAGPRHPARHSLRRPVRLVALILAATGGALFVAAQRGVLTLGTLERLPVAVDGGLPAGSAQYLVLFAGVVALLIASVAIARAVLSRPVRLAEPFEGSRAWVRRAAQDAQDGSQNVTADPRARMRADPFAKLAREARKPI